MQLYQIFSVLCITIMIILLLELLIAWVDNDYTLLSMELNIIPIQNQVGGGGRLILYQIHGCD